MKKGYRQDPFARPLIVLLMLSLLAVLIYSNTFFVPLAFDDIPRLALDPKIKHIWNFVDPSNSRYVGYLSFALNYRFGGLDVFGYHLVNLLIHISNGFLVYSLVLLLFKASRSREDRSSQVAFAAALLFIAHPLQTQAVTYVVQRFTSLATLFYLLGVVGYLKWRLSPEERKRRTFWYVVALVATTLAMKTKEMAFTLPFVLSLVEILFFRPLALRRWIYLTPFLATLSIIPLSSFDGGWGSAETIAASKISWSDYLLTQFRVIVTYLRLFFLPIGQNLDYDYPVYHSLWDPPVLASFLFLLGLLVLAGSFLRRNRLIAFGIFWFFLTLSSESSIIPIDDVIFEHRLYLPSVGVFLIAGLVWRSAGNGRVIRLVSMGTILLLLSAAAYQRNRVWKDPVTLWRDVVTKAPNKARGHYGLGFAYSDRGLIQEAIRAYETSIRLDPHGAEAHASLGNAYAKLGRLDSAVQSYQAALKLKPDDADTHYNLGVVYTDQGRIEEAIKEHEAALRLQPDFANAHHNLGTAYAAQGRWDEAIQEYRTGLRLQPDDAEMHYNLGTAYISQNRWEEAVQEYLAALNLKPGYVDVHNNLGNIYAAQGRWNEAIQEYQEALRLRPGDAEVRNNLDNAYRRKSGLLR